MSASTAGVPVPDATTRWRCAQCGNLTRFDVTRSRRSVDFVHVDLSGESRVEESKVLHEVVSEVRCRWCGSTRIELAPRPVGGDS